MLMSAITLLAALVRAPRLAFPSQKYFDEVYYVDAAQALLNGQPDPNSVHPPLAKLIIAAGIWATKWFESVSGIVVAEPVGWRVTTLLAALAIVPIVYWMGFRLSEGNTAVAAVSAGLVATDCLHLVQSRICMLDMFLALFALVGAAFALKFIQEGPRLSLAVLAGLAFGAATACKWSGLFAAAGACVSMMLLALPTPVPEQGRRLRLYLPLIFAVTIAVAFLASYTPHFVRSGANLSSVQAIGQQGERMVRFRYDEKQFTHQYKSEFWKWPLVFRPVWYYYETPTASTVQGVVCLGSVVFWWAFLCFFAEASFLAVTTRDRMRGFAIVNYLANWLPWIVSTTGGFIYYMLPGIPFMAFITSLTLADWWQGRKGLIAASVYLVAVVLAFALLYPFLVGLEVPKTLFKTVFFSPTWI